jgi:hypothetical protein
MQQEREHHGPLQGNSAALRPVATRKPLSSQAARCTSAAPGIRIIPGTISIDDTAFSGEIAHSTNWSTITPNSFRIGESNEAFLPVKMMHPMQYAEYRLT